MQVVIETKEEARSRQKNIGRRRQQKQDGSKSSSATPPRQLGPQMPVWVFLVVTIGLGMSEPCCLAATV